MTAPRLTSAMFYCVLSHVILIELVSVAGRSAFLCVVSDNPSPISWILRHAWASAANAAILLLAVMFVFGVFDTRNRVFWWAVWTLLAATFVGSFLGYVMPYGQISFWISEMSGWRLAPDTLLLGGPLLAWGALTTALFWHVARLATAPPQNPFAFRYSAVGVLAVAAYAAYCVFGFPSAGVDFTRAAEASRLDANPLWTPVHILPEWHVVPFYAVLRAVPDKLGGVIALFCAIGVWALVPLLDRGGGRPIWRAGWSGAVRAGVLACLAALGWLGVRPAIGADLVAAQILTAVYFALFLVASPLAGRGRRRALPPNCAPR